MKNICLTILTVLFAITGAEAQKLPTRASILKAMETANDYFIAKYPDPAKPTFVKKERPSNLWTRGVYFEGLKELTELEYASHGEKAGTYRRYIMEWGNAHRWTPRNGVTTRDADDYCCSQTYIDMYLITGGEGNSHKDEMIAPTRQCMTNLLARNNADWTWIDAIQMGLPVLAKLARAEYIAERKVSPQWLEKGWQMYTWTRDTLAGGLYNKADALWWRDKDFVPPYTEPNGEDCYWSRGNGWVYAALVRTLDAMMMADGADAFSGVEPLECQNWTMLPFARHADDYIADFKAMSEALLRCQRKDGYWNVSLHDGGHFGGKELTGTALFVYGMAWGVRHKILDQEKYLPVINRSWRRMVKQCLHKNGFLGYVQGTGKEPKDSQPVGYKHEPDFDDFGLGCFLLAGSEVYRLAH